MRFQVKREGSVIAQDLVIKSLKVNSTDVKEIDKGGECGIVFKNFNEFEAGDLIEAYI